MASGSRDSFSLILLLAISLSLSVSVRSQTKPSTSPKDFSEVRKLIQKQMEAKSIPSISVAVARKGNIIWEEAFGFADTENRVRANQQSYISKEIYSTELSRLDHGQAHAMAPG